MALSLAVACRDVQVPQNAQAEQTVANAAAGIQEVYGLIADTSRASMEQVTSTQEMSRALTALDGVTQQNAALVEEGMATTASFEQEAKRMSELVGLFKLLPTKDEERGGRLDTSATNVPSQNALQSDKPLRLVSGT